MDKQHETPQNHFVSPYLQAPLRTLEEALRERDAKLSSSLKKDTAEEAVAAAAD